MSEEIIINKEENIKYIQIKRFLDRGIKHAFYMRHGGISKNEYESLNFRTIGKDSISNVLENLKRAGMKINVNYKNTVKGMQAHTDIVKEITKENMHNYKVENQSKEEIDALITKEKNIPLLITTADCTPILILDEKQNIVANIHSGWKGTVKRIYIKTVEKLINENGSSAKDLVIAIGPCIRKCCWTTEDKELIEKLEKEWNIDYIEKIENKYHVDFIKCIKEDLIGLGILKENIIDTNICTCCNTEDYFSFRYNTMKKIKEYGTQATIIEI